MSNRLLQGGGVRTLQGGGNRLLEGSGVTPPAGGGSLPPFWALFPGRAAAEAPPARRDARARAAPVRRGRRVVGPLARATQNPLPRRADARAEPEPAAVPRYYPRAARAAAEPPPPFYRARPARAAAGLAVVEWWTAWHRELEARIRFEDEMLMLGGFGRGP